MPARCVGILSGPLLILAGVLPILTYRITIGAVSPRLIGAILVTQVTAIAWLAARNLAVRYRAIVAIAGVSGAAAAVIGLGLPARSAGLAVGGVCHGAAYAVLLTRFATSLRPRREPVVTGFARQIRPTIPDKVVRYTRHVTIAWCVFFAAQLGVSITLLALAPVVVWSTFVNLWNIPLIVTMMLAEFGCRLFLLRREPRTGLIATVGGLRHISGPAGKVP
jgi:uncharacterized membrane protein